MKYRHRAFRLDRSFSRADDVLSRHLFGGSNDNFVAMPITAFDAGKLSPADTDGTGKWVNWTPFTYPFNLTQQPAASVPCGFTADGLPAGLHVVGRMFYDQTVLAACHAYEQATEWNSRRPNLD